jgi:superfamily II DNA or RNA helicase
LPFIQVAVSDYRRLEVDTSGGVNPWSSVACAVTTIDVLRESRRLGATLAARWNLVIIDECHLPGPGTQGAFAIEQLWNESSLDVVVASTATPTTVLTFAGPGTSGAPFRIWTYDFEELVEHWWPTVSARIVKLTATEATLLGGVYALLDRGGDPALGPTRGSELRRRAGSSLITLDTALRSLLARGELASKTLVGGDFAADEELSDSPTTPTDEPVGAEDLQGLIGLLGEVEVDSKAEALADLLAGELAGGLVVVFSDFADTVNYLVEYLRGEGLVAYPLTGESTPDERYEALRAVDARAGVVIASTASVQGLDFGGASSTVHYDLPRSAQGMMLRMSRVDRLGRDAGPSIALVDDLSATPELLGRLGLTWPDATYDC